MSHYKSLLSNIRLLTTGVIELTLVRADNQAWPTWRAGQYATLSFPNIKELKGSRSFSIVSPPNDSKVWQFGIRVGGKYTSALRRLRVGDAAEVMGPFGQFTYEPDRDGSALFIAGGIGITPILSMIRYAVANKSTNDLSLLYSVRSLADAPYLDEIESLAQDNKNFHPFYAVTDGRVRPGNPRMLSGRITSVMETQAVNGQLAGRSYFLCGQPSFMKAITKSLQALGITNEDIRTERFSAGSSELFERSTNLPKYVLAGWGMAAVIVLGAVVHQEQAKRNPEFTTPTNNNLPTGATNQTNGNTNRSVTAPSNGNNQNQTTQRVVPTNTNTAQPSQPTRVVPRTTVS